MYYSFHSDNLYYTKNGTIGNIWKNKGFIAKFTENSTILLEESICQHIR